MSYHIYPSGGRENYLRSRPRYPPGMLKPIQRASTVQPFTSTINSGWNDAVLLPVSKLVGRQEPEWESPTVNVLPTEQSKSSLLSSRPFGTMPKPVALPTIARTPLQSMGARSEHWHSDPIHGLFSGCVPEDSARWTTSNRNVFCVRNGVCNSPVSSGIMQRVMDASNGSISSNDFAKPYLSRSQHCWERVNPDCP